MVENEVTKVMLRRNSCRSYSDKVVEDEKLEIILKVARQAPNSINGQQVSVVVVRDVEVRTKLSELVGNQAHVKEAPIFIAILADFNKTKKACEISGNEQIIHESLEGFTVGAIDSGIVLSSLITCANSLGLGAVSIGSLRKCTKECVELLNLPKYTYPMVGLCIGYPKSEEIVVKPRLAMKTFAHYEKYDDTNLADAIKSYDEVVSDYMKTVNRSNLEPSYSKFVGAFYSQIYLPETYEGAVAQGFKFNK